MIISFQCPEERFASTSWEAPIYHGNICVKSVLFLPAAPIYPDGGVCRLILRDEKEDLACLVIESDVRRFQALNFHVEVMKDEIRTLILRKEIAVGKNIAIPSSLVQVESWQ